MKYPSQVSPLESKKSDELSPSVSIIIPAHNNEKTIGQTLESLKTLEYPRAKIEIIVVDDASTDRTGKVALQHGCRVIKREKKGGCAPAKNTGVAQARNEIVAFIDADVFVTKDWLRELVAPFKDSSVGGVGGRIKNEFRKNNALEKFIEYDNYYRTRKVEAKSVPGSNSAYRREIFDIVGKMDPYIGEDPDFCYRVSSRGYKLVYIQKAVVYHPYPNDVVTYLKKQVYYAWQRVLIYLLRPECRSIMTKDEQTPKSIIIQPFVWMLLVLSLLFVPFFNFVVYFSLFLFLLLIVLSAPLLRYVYGKEPKIVPYSLGISFPRSFAYALGIVQGVLSFVKIKTIGIKTGVS